ncbi:MAG TPA: RNA polymerase sigma factor, partial [Ktedonobacter sp.]|nr:RNA polymerase sigma factor [Ktedonobacter sp.]
MASALRLCHQQALAEEITQGAFLLAWRGLARFHEGSPFRPW